MEIISNISNFQTEPAAVPVAEVVKKKVVCKDGGHGRPQH